MLYIVATPIGNLEDMSLRAIRILGQVSLVAAEDTRKTRILLGHYQIKTKLTSYYEHSKQSKTAQLIDKLASGEDIALVSEAGMPGISDPGYELIAAAIENNIDVIPIPGASAITTALVTSGLPPSQFTYLGFLPRKKSDRKKLLESVGHITHTLIAYESPHRIKASLSDIELVLGNRRIAVCRELTKLHEEVFRGNISQAIEHFDNPRGEFTLVIEGSTDEKQVDTSSVASELDKLKKDGIKAKEATAQISKKYGLTRNEVYNIWLSL